MYSVMLLSQYSHYIYRISKANNHIFVLIRKYFIRICNTLRHFTIFTLRLSNTEIQQTYFVTNMKVFYQLLQIPRLLYYIRTEDPEQYCANHKNNNELAVLL